MNIGERYLHTLTPDGHEIVNSDFVTNLYIQELPGLAGVLRLGGKPHQISGASIRGFTGQSGEVKRRHEKGVSLVIFPVIGSELIYVNDVQTRLMGLNHADFLWQQIQLMLDIGGSYPVLSVNTTDPVTSSTIRPFMVKPGQDYSIYWSRMMSPEPRFMVLEVKSV